MNPEDHPNPEYPRGTHHKPGTDGFIKSVGQEVGKELLRETGTTIKWAVGGAIGGAIALGGLGLWKFGTTGLAIGAIVGAVVGGVTGGWIYFSA